MPKDNFEKTSKLVFCLNLESILREKWPIKKVKLIQIKK